MPLHDHPPKASHAHLIRPHTPALVRPLTHSVSSAGLVFLKSGKDRSCWSNSLLTQVDRTSDPRSGQVDRIPLSTQNMTSLDRIACLWRNSRHSQRHDKLQLWRCAESESPVAFVRQRRPLFWSHLEQNVDADEISLNKIRRRVYRSIDV